jgi:hypothetical protein
MGEFSSRLDSSEEILKMFTGRNTVVSQSDFSLVLMAPLPPLPRRHRLRIGPQAFPRLSCALL